MKNTQIKIFDTTLRDGEQSPGCSMTIREKIEVAQQLERLGVDIIEAGFAISSKGDYEAIQEISDKCQSSTICSLARAVPKDIITAANAIKKANKQRIHTFIATSPIHMKYKLKMTEKDVLKLAIDSVKEAKRYVNDVEFSCEDAGRSDKQFLVEVYQAVVDAGATVINVPDTVGYQTPDEFGELIHYLNKHIKRNSNIDISVHCHNDLGFATGNALFGIINGATQVECTINGIGERAGNTALEEIVMAIDTRKDRFKFSHNINIKEIYKTSKLISTITGSMVQANKAIVGKNAFAHEAGIHQDGILKFQSTYEIIDAKSIGLSHNSLVLGKHSGRHAFKEKVNDLGHQLSQAEFEKAFERFKLLADKKKSILDEDIETILADEVYQLNEIYSLDYLEVNSKNTEKPFAIVRLFKNNIPLEAKSEGYGTVDAIYKAIEEIVNETFDLKDFSVQSVTQGTDALGIVSVKLTENNRTYTGKGSSTDIAVSAAKAYIMAINHLISSRGKKKIYAQL